MRRTAKKWLCHQVRTRHESEDPPLQCRGLFGATAEEAEDDTGRGPIVVLVEVGAERGAVVVDIEQTDVDVPGGVDIQSAAGFVGETVIGSLVTAGTADGRVGARSPDEGFHERGQAPAIARTVKVAGPEVISVEYV